MRRLNPRRGCLRLRPGELPRAKPHAESPGKVVSRLAVLTRSTKAAGVDSFRCRRAREKYPLDLRCRTAHLLPPKAGEKDGAPSAKPMASFARQPGRGRPGLHVQVRGGAATRASPLAGGAGGGASIP